MKKNVDWSLEKPLTKKRKFEPVPDSEDEDEGEEENRDHKREMMLRQSNAVTLAFENALSIFTGVVDEIRTCYPSCDTESPEWNMHTFQALVEKGMETQVLEFED